MSMISAQIDELRAMAQLEKSLERPAIARILGDAADTIWQLRDDLQRANDAVRDAEHDESRAWDRVRMKDLALDVESIALALSEEGGYEYYHIDDDLKELAKNVSDMQAENARLREQVDAAHMSRLLTENENEKLRELCSDVWHLFTEHGAVNPCDLPVIDAVRDRMRELGVEVDG